MHDESIKLPSQGWRQFLVTRKELLDAYDQARRKASVRKVEAFHGSVGEAAVRKWLSAFLPKRFGVTSGYVISTSRGSEEKAPHFDVIIYDQLNSPVLWIEDSPDSTNQGASQAIPVEHVFCVIEVKAKLSPKTAAEAISHLSELLPLLDGVEDASVRYKTRRPPHFSCAVLFFELEKKFEYSEKLLAKFLEGPKLRGFLGGIVLRGEGHSTESTGRIQPLVGDVPMQSTIGRTKASLLEHAFCGSVKLSGNRHLNASLIWAEFQFSTFAFDLLAIMQGTYQPGRLSSMYGFGMSNWEE